MTTEPLTDMDTAHCDICGCRAVFDEMQSAQTPTGEITVCRACYDSGLCVMCGKWFSDHDLIWDGGSPTCDSCWDKLHGRKIAEQ